eukprot:41016-Rhodomonas_salina.1
MSERRWMRPRVKSAMILRASYAVSGTDVGAWCYQSCTAKQRRSSRSTTKLSSPTAPFSSLYAIPSCNQNQKMKCLPCVSQWHSFHASRGGTGTCVRGDVRAAEPYLEMGCRSDRTTFLVPCLRISVLSSGEADACNVR